MSLLVCRANSLARMTSEKHSLTLVTPSPVPLLSGGGTNTVIFFRLRLSKID
jgi:hypothetical protein